MIRKVARRLDLDEHNFAVTLDHKIKFTGRTPPAARQDGIAFARVNLGDLILCCPTLQIRNLTCHVSSFASSTSAI